MKFPIDLMPAAGWCKTVEQVRALAKIPVISHIVMGSFTVAAREGNMGGTNFVILDDGTSFNSLGLPNGGIPYLEENLEQMLDIIHEAGKTSVLSIAADTPEEYLDIARFADEYGVNVLEWNFGCPNKFVDDGKQKEIVSYRIELICEVFAEFKNSFDGLDSYPVSWIKTSPFANPEERARVASLIAKTKMGIERVTICNTFPNCVPRGERGNLLITAKNTNGRAGMAGTSLRHIALANAEHFRELLPKKIGINGVGGISSGDHLAAYHRIGCAGAQIGTAFFNGENFRIFEQIAAEFVEATEIA